MWERAIDAVKESVSEKPEVAVAVVCGVELSSCPIPLVYDKLETRQAESLSAAISSGCGCFWRSFFFVGDNRESSALVPTTKPILAHLLLQNS